VGGGRPKAHLDKIQDGKGKFPRVSVAPKVHFGNAKLIVSIRKDEPGGKPPAAGSTPGRRAFALHAPRPGPASA